MEAPRVHVQGGFALLSSLSSAGGSMFPSQQKVIFILLLSSSC